MISPGRPSRGCPSARRRARAPAVRRRPARSPPLALTAGQPRRPMVMAVPEPDPFERLSGGRPPLGRPGRRGRAGRRRRCRARLALHQEELLEHEADPPRAKADSWRSDSPADVLAGDPHRPLRRPVEGADQVQQRGLARAGRADDGDQLPSSTRRSTPRRASTGGGPGYRFTTSSAPPPRSRRHRHGVALVESAGADLDPAVGDASSTPTITVLVPSSATCSTA